METKRDGESRETRAAQKTSQRNDAKKSKERKTEVTSVNVGGDEVLISTPAFEEASKVQSNQSQSNNNTGAHCSRLLHT